jgi:DNA-binding response OmpR family regulator
MPNTQIAVLVADDDPSFAQSFAKLLRKRGFYVDTANTPEQTFALLEERNGLYDVIVLDAIFAAGITMVGLIRQIKALYSGIEVIVLTGWGLESQSVREAMEAGAYRYMAKPIHSEEIEICIQTAIQSKTLKLEKQSNDQADLVRILFLAANPLDNTRLRLDEEIRAVDSALLQTEFRDRFDIRQHWAVRVTDLQSHLLRHKPNIVHFSGHGGHTCEIILEDGSGNSRPVSIRALSNLFSVLKDNIRCVILNACYSEQQALAISKHIDCVIGMSKAIGDSSAISFAASFYQGLGYGRDVKTAFDLGCAQIDLENLGEEDVPKLIADRIDPRMLFFVHP